MLLIHALEANLESSQAYKREILAILFWNFVSFQSPRSWFIESRVLAGFFQSLESLWSLAFHLFPVWTSFAYPSQNSMPKEFSCKAASVNGCSN